MIRDDADEKAILAKVRNGELSPQAAEEWATKPALSMARR